MTASGVGPVGGGNAASIAASVARIERERQRVAVRANVLEIRRTREWRSRPGARSDPAQRELRRRRSEIARDRRQLALAQQRSLPQRRIGHERDPRARASTAGAPIRCRARPGDREPDWSRSDDPREAQRARACPRCRNWTRPSAGSCRPRAAARTRRRSRRAECGRANAADRDRADPCRAVVRLRSQAEIALFRPALCGYTLLTTNSRSRRPAIARATISSAPPSPYISAVSTSVIPRSKPSESAAASAAARALRSPMVHVPRPSAGTRRSVRQRHPRHVGGRARRHGAEHTGT